MNSKSTNPAPYIRISGLSKRYGSVHALDQVDFELDRGEVVALLGQNGAGKSTLAKILAGFVRPDSGRFEIDGQVVDQVQVSKRVAIVQQELSLVPCLSVAENIFLGGSFKGAWSPRRLADAARPHLETVGLGSLNPSTIIDSLSLAEKQLVELARAVSRRAEIVILDEPTAALSDSEIARVQAVIHSLVETGKGIVFITHRLSEVFAIANKAIIVQNGKSQKSIPIAGATLSDLIERMLGRSLEKMFPERTPVKEKRIVCEVKGLMTNEIASPLTFSVKEGEIIGFAGQIGCGMSSILRAIVGCQERLAGEIILYGEQVAPRNIRQGISLGIAYCSSERRVDGVFMNRSLVENLTAPALKSITPAGFLSSWRQEQLSGNLAEMFTIEKNRLKNMVSTLSGGNQQKVTLGKWMGITPKLLLIEEPTRGVDVGARAEIYEHLRKLADLGLPIIFSSTDLQEILGFADTVITFYRGGMIRQARAETLCEADVINDVTHSSGSTIAATPVL